MLHSPFGRCVDAATSSFSRSIILPAVVTWLSAVFLATTSSAQSPEPGIYSSDAEGEGIRVRRNDGQGFLYLDQRIVDDFGTVKIRSASNDNRLFRIQIEFPQPLEEGVIVFPAVITTGTDHLVVQSTGGGEVAWLNASIHGEQAARRIATFFEVDPNLREHPGHRLKTTWTPSKDSYQIGETVKLKMSIENLGDVPVSFIVGGQQRGTRDNQYRFLARASHGYGAQVPDTGDPNHFGGISTIHKLEPGAVYESETEIDRWFDFEAADTYRITGLFELSIVEPDSWTEIWADFAVGQCNVQITSIDK